jgi:hypothetical protein
VPQRSLLAGFRVEPGRARVCRCEHMLRNHPSLSGRGGESRHRVLGECGVGWAGSPRPIQSSIFPVHRVNLRPERPVQRWKSGAEKLARRSGEVEKRRAVYVPRNAMERTWKQLDTYIGERVCGAKEVHTETARSVQCLLVCTITRDRRRDLRLLLTGFFFPFLCLVQMYDSSSAPMRDEMWLFFCFFPPFCASGVHSCFCTHIAPTPEKRRRKETAKPAPRERMKEEEEEEEEEDLVVAFRSPTPARDGRRTGTVERNATVLACSHSANSHRRVPAFQPLSI